MSILKKLAGETAVYGLSTIAGRFLNYLLVPLHTSLFASAEYGIITDLYAGIAFLNVVYTYGMETAFFRFATKKEYTGQEAFHNAFNSLFMTSMLFSGFIFYFSGEIATSLGYPERKALIEWVAWILAADAIVAIPFARIRLLGKVYLFAMAKIFNIGVNIALNVFFLVVCPLLVEHQIGMDLLMKWYKPEWNVEYVFIANLLANLTYFPFLLPALTAFRFKIHWKIFREMIVYAFPILLMGVAGTINEMFSRLMLKNWLPDGFYPNKSNLEMLGIFGANYKLAVFMTITIQAFRYASEPFFFTNARNRNAPEVFAKVMHYFVWVTICIFLFISINKHWIAAFFLKQEEYLLGTEIVPILLLANIFLGIYYNLSVWYKLTDKTYWGTYITVVGAALTIGFNYWFIPNLGIMGSVYATLVCYGIMAMMSYIVGQHYYPIPYQKFRLMLTIFITVLLYYGLSFVPETNNNWILINGITVIYCGLLFGIEYISNRKIKVKSNP